MNRSVQKTTTRERRPNFCLPNDPSPLENQQTQIGNNNHATETNNGEKLTTENNLSCEKFTNIENEAEAFVHENNSSFPFTKVNNLTYHVSPANESFAALGKIRKVHQQNKENYQRSKSLETISKQPKFELEESEEMNLHKEGSSYNLHYGGLKGHFFKKNKDHNVYGKNSNSNLKKLKSQNELNLAAENVRERFLQNSNNFMDN